MAVEIHDMGISLKGLRAKAKALSKSEDIPLHAAQNRVAQQLLDKPNEISRFEHTLTWAELVRQCWKLNPENILVRRGGAEIEQPPGVEKPNLPALKQRWEIENPMFNSGLIETRGDWQSDFRARFRIYRWVDDGTLVERVVINKAETCFDSDVEDPARCDCCSRHDFNKTANEWPGSGADYAATRLSPTVENIAIFSVLAFGGFCGQEVLAKDHKMIYSNRSAEALVRWRGQREKEDERRYISWVEALPSEEAGT